MATATRRRGGTVAAGAAPGEVSRAQVMVAFAAVYVVWGSTYLAIRFAIETIPPFLMAGVRFLVSGAALYAWMRARGEPRPSAANWRATVIVGAFLLVGGNGGVTWAEQRVPSGLAALLVATVPLWMVLLEWVRGGVRPAGRVWLGLAVGFLGLGILVGPATLLGGGGADPLGAGGLVLASVLWAIGSVYSKRAALPSSPLLATGMEMLGGGALLVLVGTLTGEWAGLDPAAVTPSSALGLAYLIVFGSGVGFTAYIWLLKHVEVAKVSTYAYVNPVVAVFLGWAFAGEPVSARTLLAAATIITAVMFITGAGRKREVPPVDPALEGQRDRAQRQPRPRPQE